MKTTLLLILLLFGFHMVSAHSGGTDRQGGHTDHYTGDYHFHHGYGPHDHPNGICALKEPSYPAIKETSYPTLKKTDYIINKTPLYSEDNSHHGYPSFNKTPNNTVWFVGIMGLGVGLLIRGPKKNNSKKRY